MGKAGTKTSMEETSIQLRNQRQRTPVHGTRSEFQENEFGKQKYRDEQIFKADRNVYVIWEQLLSNL